MLVHLTFALSLLVSSRAIPSEPVHAIAGDRSWVELHGAPPRLDTPEDDRIAVHLAWVESRLRDAPAASLSPQQRFEREAMLDTLRAYREARAFPRWHGEVTARRPRWIDDEGRHCAVAALIRASGDHALVRAVQTTHEGDLVRDMRVPALASWARAHGLTVEELALIQPTYDHGSVEVPSELEQRRAREEARAQARIPRPLTSAQVRDLLRRFDGHVMAHACAGDRTGHWSMASTLRVDRGFAVRAEVRIVALGGSDREPELERCARRELTRALRQLIASARHTLPRAIEERSTHAMHVHSPEEIEAALLADERAWHRAGTRREALAACMAEVPGTGPLRVPLRVSGGNGEVSIRWDALSAEPLRMPSAERETWHCIQDVVINGSLAQHGVRAHDIDLDLHRDGTLRRAVR